MFLVKITFITNWSKYSILLSKYDSKTENDILKIFIYYSNININIDNINESRTKIQTNTKASLINLPHNICNFIFIFCILLIINFTLNILKLQFYSVYSNTFVREYYSGHKINYKLNIDFDVFKENEYKMNQLNTLVNDVKIKEKIDEYKSNFDHENARNSKIKEKIFIVRSFDLNMFKCIYLLILIKFQNNKNEKSTNIGNDDEIICEDNINHINWEKFSKLSIVNEYVYT